MLELKKGGISMKKDDFTEEELKALYSGFLDRNCDPAPETVSEAYTAISKAQEDYLCALDEYQFREVFMYGYELGMKSAEGKGQ